MLITFFQTNMINLIFIVLSVTETTVCCRYMYDPQLGHIILIPSQPVFAFTPQCWVLGSCCLIFRAIVMVFNAIFNNISVIQWRLTLLVEETGKKDRKLKNQLLASGTFMHFMFIISFKLRHVSIPKRCTFSPLFSRILRFSLISCLISGMVPFL